MGWIRQKDNETKVMKTKCITVTKETYDELSKVLGELLSKC
jgi:hypothetical protein